MELRTDEDRTSISVLGIRQNLMQYNLYDSSNAVLEADMQMDNNYFYAESNKQSTYNIHVGYNLREIYNRLSIRTMKAAVWVLTSHYKMLPVT